MDKQEQIKKAAEKRVNRVLTALAAWGDLAAGRFALAFEGEAVDQMEAAIRDALISQRKRFQEQRLFSFEGDNERDGTDSTEENPATVE